MRLQFSFVTIVSVTPYLRGRLRFLLVLGFVTQGISLQVSKCLAEQIKPWFFSSFYWKRLKLLKLTLFISQSWLFDFNATWKIFKELNSKWKRMSFSWVLGTLIYGFYCKQICNNTRIICRIKKKSSCENVKSHLPIFLYMGTLYFLIELKFWTKTLDYTGFVSESRWNMKPLHQFIQRNRLNLVYQT